MYICVCICTYAYVYVYSIILTPINNLGSPQCPCKHRIQTVDHLIFQCNRLKNERETLKTSVLKAGNWPVSKS